MEDYTLHLLSSSPQTVDPIPLAHNRRPEPLEKPKRRSQARIFPSNRVDPEHEVREVRRERLLHERLVRHPEAWDQHWTQENTHSRTGPSTAWPSPSQAAERTPPPPRHRARGTPADSGFPHRAPSYLGVSNNLTRPGLTSVRELLAERHLRKRAALFSGGLLFPALGLGLARGRHCGGEGVVVSNRGREDGKEQNENVNFWTRSRD